jgi:hypothetical protein
LPPEALVNLAVTVSGSTGSGRFSESSYLDGTTSSRLLDDTSSSTDLN